jgi:hypothetical protein
MFTGFCGEIKRTENNGCGRKSLQDFAGLIEVMILLTRLQNRHKQTVSGCDNNIPIFNKLPQLERVYQKVSIKERVYQKACINVYTGMDCSYFNNY